MTKIGWREREKEGRGLFFSSSDTDNLMFKITIYNREDSRFYYQAVQSQSNIHKCNWDGRLEEKERRGIQGDLKYAKRRTGCLWIELVGQRPTT